MEKRMIIHPRIMKRVMEDFLNEVSKVTYEEITIPKEGIIEITNKKAFIKLTHDNCFAVCTSDVGEPVIRMIYNINDLCNQSSKNFRKNMNNLDKITKGFADITLTLLHEVGHISNLLTFDNYDRRKAITEILQTTDNNQLDFLYFNLPDEVAATEWAIEWLHDKENRKLAKKFEKKFFDCFE